MDGVMVVKGRKDLSRKKARNGEISKVKRRRLGEWGQEQIANAGQTIGNMTT